MRSAKLKSDVKLVAPKDIVWPESCRRRLDTDHGQEAVETSKERWLNGDLPEPIKVVETPTGLVGADGFIRCQGAIKAQVSLVPVELLSGDEIDAIAYGLRENQSPDRPLRLTRADVHARLGDLFARIESKHKADPSWSRPSNRQIAKMVGVVPTTIGNFLKRNPTIHARFGHRDHPDRRIVIAQIGPS